MAAIKPSPPWLALLLLVAAKVGVTMAVADRYGWHRDELYYLASSRHPALGYVDYPPITPLLAKLDQAIFPGSLSALRLLTVLAGAVSIVVAALIARELGGNRVAQSLAALAVLISPMFVGANVLFQTVSFDQLIWAVACLLYVRLLRGADPREWLMLGLVFGIGLETKYTVIGLGVAILVGLLTTNQRQQLAGRWPWLGFALAIVLFVPNLAWQAGHHWDSVAYTLNHRGATDGPIAYWIQQLLLAGPQLLPVVVMGVVWLWRREQFRSAAVTIIAVELFFFLVGGKAYYPAPIYPLAYAAGCVWFVEAVRQRWIRRVAVAVAVAITLVLLPIGLPILPAKTMADSGIWKARKDFADMYGWPDLVQQVTTIYGQLPLADRDSVMILAGNYGEAGALDFYGRGLPTVVSAHLSYYYWTPAHMTPSTVIVVGYPREYLASFFGDIQQAATITNSYGLRNEEYGKSIWICRSPLVPLDQAWPRLKALD